MGRIRQYKARSILKATRSWGKSCASLVVDSSFALCTPSAITGVASDEKALAIEFVFESDDPAVRRSALKKVVGRGKGQSPSLSISMPRVEQKIAWLRHYHNELAASHVCDRLMKRFPPVACTPPVLYELAE
ncbi:MULTISPECIES: hypothetical protein [Caballeronia]|jgi:hypothetical protein|nr:hypothetical protein [Caballeronia zhejiangensis]MCI1047715.1 hypothetical protein [Caballeronia zhejiangensis]